MHVFNTIPKTFGKNEGIELQKIDRNKGIYI